MLAGLFLWEFRQLYGVCAWKLGHQRTTMPTPTKTSYPEMEQAFDRFNEELFDGRLPTVMITLQRKANSAGYFAPERFVDSRGRRVDELAMNPSLFRQRDTIQTLSTLVHEMTHLEQARFGTPGRRGYHNREWADRMIAIGLHPSDTGAPGGKHTGERMTHYIVAGGRFHTVATALIASGFTLSWGDYVLPTEEGDGGPVVGPAGARKRMTAASSGRVRFQCPKCKSRAWGKPSLRVACADCRQLMQA